MNGLNSKEERSIVEAMNRKRTRKPAPKSEKEFVAVETHVTIDKKLPAPDQTEDVAFLKELRD